MKTAGRLCAGPRGARESIRTQELRSATPWPCHSPLATAATQGLPAAAPRRLLSRRRQRVTSTHTEKLMYPEAGHHQREVLEFYRRMAPRLLPYLRDRPATLERLPEGLDGSAGAALLAETYPRVLSRRGSSGLSCRAQRGASCPLCVGQR